MKMEYDADYRILFYSLLTFMLGLFAGMAVLWLIFRGMAMLTGVMLQ